jgi:hypothetical protein
MVRLEAFSFMLSPVARPDNVLNDRFAINPNISD